MRQYMFGNLVVSQVLDKKHEIYNASIVYFMLFFIFTGSTLSEISPYSIFFA